MVLPIKRIRPYSSKKSKQRDSVILDWEPINLHRMLQATMEINQKDYWVCTRYEYEPNENGENKSKVSKVFHTVMFRYRKDAKRFSLIADPVRL